MSRSSSARTSGATAARSAGCWSRTPSLLLVINASPFERDKDEVRLPLVTRRAVETSTTVAYVNIVGGQDDLVFDGDSVVVDPDGRILARAPQFDEHLLFVDLDLEAAGDVPLPENVARVTLDVPDDEPA